jgi:hypothetical protein
VKAWCGLQRGARGTIRCRGQEGAAGICVPRAVASSQPPQPPFSGPATPPTAPPPAPHTHHPAQVIVSLMAVAAFAFIALPALTYFTGPWGLVKYWLMPWLGYHFWMSTFTVIHHTAPHIPFKAASEWNAAKAQLSGTVHCDFPAW